MLLVILNVFLLKLPRVQNIKVNKQKFGSWVFIFTRCWLENIHFMLQIINNYSSACFIPAFLYPMIYLKVKRQSVILFLVFIFIIDAKDILRRMLAPDIITRASLDLIIYHPWLQPYRHLLVEQSLPIQQDPTPKVIKKKKKIKPFKQAVLFIFHGPFPPPKKPYQDLSHLGTRESVFARQRQL